MGLFDQLSDLDFEELVADLFTESTGYTFRAGGPGADAGIDVLGRGPDGGLHVIQCKHYKHSSYPMLKRAAQHEANRLATSELAMASYSFVTSRRLTHVQRAELAEVLRPHVASVELIYGEADLEDLLAKHQAVEQRHVKLWLWRSAQLKRMLTAASYQRSRALLTEARRAVPRYVQTRAFDRAREMLSEERVLVIAGPAGVGKTTLARLLLLDRVESGAQPYEIVPGELSDAWSLLDLAEDQIFYFDDFLGQTSLASAREEYGDLLRFMRAVADKPGSRFVLATREYLMREARQLSEVFMHGSSEAQRFMLRLSDYDRFERARIFYTHVWSSPEVDDLALHSLLANQRYLEIIDHSGYNPRVIEWITGFGLRKLSPDDRRDYASFCLEVLTNPRELWTHAFEVGISDHARVLLFAIPGLPARVTVRAIERAFEEACRVRHLSTAGRRFVKTLEILDDSFLATVQLDKDVGVTVINPSLIDFLGGYLQESSEDAIASLRSAAFFEQVEWLANILWVRHQEHEPEVSNAYRRTFVASSPESLGGGVSNRQGQDASVEIEDRLRRIAATLPLWPIQHTRLWLRDIVEKWALALEPHDFLVTERHELLARLVHQGLVRPAPVVARILEAIDTENLFEPLERFECIASLISLDASAFPEERRDDERDRLEDFAEEALADPTEVLGDSRAVERLAEVADVFMLELPDGGLASAPSVWDELEENGDDEVPQPESAEVRVAVKGGGISDDAIREMFERLAVPGRYERNDTSDA